MTQETQILQFPRNKIVREILPESEHLKELKKKNTRNFADTLVQDLSEEILVSLTEVGLETSGDVFAKDFHFFVGALNSMIYRTLGIDHDLHNFVDNNVNIKKIDAQDLVDKDE